MRRLVTCPISLQNRIFLLLFFLLVGSKNVEAWRSVNGRQGRPHSVSILEFGAVGDGKTLNTLAFQNAIFYLRSFADKGGAQLYVPQGRWLTGSFNLISHLTLFLENNAVIVGSSDPLAWPVTDPLPSYGRGMDLPGRRHRSLISGHNLTDVVITGQNGSIDGQGSVWWDWLDSRSLNYSRPHLVELESCNDVTISNLTLLNSPAWHLHPVYCSNVWIHNLTILSSTDRSSTSGIVPDSSSGIRIEDCTITVGGGAIALKSGWDEYGLAIGRPVNGVRIRQVKLRSATGSAILIGSEMSGGATDIRADDITISDSAIGISIETTRGRGGYVEDVTVRHVDMVNVGTAIRLSGQTGDHPDQGFDPDAIPAVRGIKFEKMDGYEIGMAGELTGVDLDHPFTDICLSDIVFSVSSNVSWVCYDVIGSSRSVFPEPCPELKAQNSSSSSSVCFSLTSSSIPKFDQ